MTIKLWVILNLWPHIDDAKAFKKHYRAVMDDLELDEQQRKSLIGEANYAFRLNMDIFDELEGNVVRRKGLGA